MIKIYYLYEANGKWWESFKEFRSRTKALRFLYGTMKRYIIQGWECTNPEDNDYLNYKFNPENKR